MTAIHLALILIPTLGIALCVSVMWLCLFMALLRDY